MSDHRQEVGFVTFLLRLPKAVIPGVTGVDGGQGREKMMFSDFEPALTRLLLPHNSTRTGLTSELHSCSAEDERFRF